jgi:hypothetical protein
MDSFMIRVHQHAAGAKREGPWAIGCFRGGLTTKIHAVVETFRPRPLASRAPDRRPMSPPPRRCLRASPPRRSLLTKPTTRKP